MVGREILGSREDQRTCTFPYTWFPHLLEEGCCSAVLKFRTSILGHSPTEWGPQQGQATGSSKDIHFMDILSSSTRLGKRYHKGMSLGVGERLSL